MPTGAKVKAIKKTPTARMAWSIMGVPHPASSDTDTTPSMGGGESVFFARSLKSLDLPGTAQK